MLSTTNPLKQVRYDTRSRGDYMEGNLNNTAVDKYADEKSHERACTK